MLKLGDKSIKSLYLGAKSIKKAYLGEKLVFNKITKPETPEPITLIGNTKIENGVLSGFDENSYAILKDVQIGSYTSSIEIVVRFTTSSDITTRQAIFDTNAEGRLHGWWVYLENGQFVWGCGNGASANSSTFVFTKGSVEPNTEYYLKLAYPDLKTMRGYVSLDGGTTYSEWFYRYNAKLNNFARTHGKMALGMAGQDSAKYDEADTCSYFFGTFNLNGSYIKEDDVIIWQGIK